MTFPVGLILGLLIGWLIEWVIDWVYWRKRTGGSDDCQEELNEAHAEIRDLKAQLATLGAELEKDALELITGIGPVIKRKLNEAGIYTFKDLGGLTQQNVEDIIGDDIRNLADEDELIRQAKKLAKEKARGRG